MGSPTHGPKEENVPVPQPDIPAGKQRVEITADPLEELEEIKEESE